MKKNILYLLILPTLLVCSDIGASPKHSELIGFWKMVKNKDLEQHNKVNPWTLPYQWFAFYKNGNFYSLMSSKNDNLSEEDLKESFSTLKNGISTYNLKGSFISIKYPNLKNPYLLWGINIFYKDVGKNIKKGDIVMSLVRSKDDEALYYRQLRKITKP
jgi:hypothetical protein